MPRHGEERSRRTETSDGPDQTMLDARTGQPVYSGPLFSRTETVSDKWCATCGDWREVRGIVGVLMGCVGCGAEW